MAEANALVELATLRAQAFEVESVVNIVQVTVNEEGTMLYALDSESGLFVFDIIGPTSYQLKRLKVELKQALAFDFHESTFFFIAHTKNRQEYALEVFVDFEQQVYYFNRLYQEDMEIFDVKVQKHWAVLIGKDIHKVVYHSVYKSFVSSFEQSTYFEDVDLVQIEMVDNKQMPYSQFSVKDENEFNFQLQSTQSYFLGLSNDDVKLFSLHNIHPRVQCFNPESSLFHYKLVMNSTDCTHKENRNDQSSFSQC